MKDSRGPQMGVVKRSKGIDLGFGDKLRSKLDKPPTPGPNPQECTEEFVINI